VRVVFQPNAVDLVGREVDEAPKERERVLLTKERRGHAVGKLGREGLRPVVEMREGGGEFLLKRRGSAAAPSGPLVREHDEVKLEFE
jgi:hypothetical protein